MKTILIICALLLCMCARKKCLDKSGTIQLLSYATELDTSILFIAGKPWNVSDRNAKAFFKKESGIHDLEFKIKCLEYILEK